MTAEERASGRRKEETKNARHIFNGNNEITWSKAPSARERRDVRYRRPPSALRCRCQRRPSHSWCLK